MPPKRHRENNNKDGSEDDVMPAPTNHSVAKTNTRNAIVAFGVGYGVLRVPIERRVAQYLRQQRLFAVGGFTNTRSTRACYSLDRVTNTWVAEAPMLEA